MKNLKTYLIIFDMFMVLVIAGLWAEGKVENKISSMQQNIPAMQVENLKEDNQNGQEKETVESTEKIMENNMKQNVEETEYFELEEKKIAITFDDGPNITYTPVLLEGLRERNVKATFFVIGQNVEKHPEVIRQMKEEGHLIGNHTYSHIQLNELNRDIFMEELKKTNEAIKNVTGEDTLYVRPPYGSWDKNFEKELNMFPVLWDIDPKDWCSEDAGKIVETVLSQAQENKIILLHDQYDTSLEAAFTIIDRLKEQGYQFVTVEEILFD